MAQPRWKRRPLQPRDQILSAGRHRDLLGHNQDLDPGGPKLAGEAMARYMRLHNEALATRIEETDGLVMIRCDTLGRQLGPARQSTELVVGVMYRILQLFLGPAWRPRSICFAHAAPVSNATHLRVFSIAPMFNQEFDGIVCRSADLEVALPSYNPAVAQQAHQYLDTLLAQSSACMADKVRQVVLSMLPVGSCSVERVALQLGVDRRTVHHLSLIHI